MTSSLGTTGSLTAVKLNRKEKGNSKCKTLISTRTVSLRLYAANGGRFRQSLHSGPLSSFMVTENCFWKADILNNSAPAAVSVSENRTNRNRPAGTAMVMSQVRNVPIPVALEALLEREITPDV